MRWLVVFLVVFAAQRAEAHPIDIGYLRIDADGAALTTVLDLDIVAAGQLIRVDGELFTAEAVGTYEAQLARATYRATQIVSDAGPCTWAPTGSIRRERRVVLLTAVATCPERPRSLSWKLGFLERLPSTFQMFIQAPAFGDQMPIVDRAAPQLELRSPEAPRSFFGAVRAGGLRVGVLEQLVFLLALLLAGGAKFNDPGWARSSDPPPGRSNDAAGGTRRELFAIAGASLVAQAATLTLAAAGILRPPQALITPLVALTIVVAAFSALAGVPHRRARLAAELGCIHGVAIDAAGSGFGFYLGTELAYLVAALVMVPLFSRAGLRKATFALGALACAYASYLVLVRL